MYIAFLATAGPGLITRLPTSNITPQHILINYNQNHKPNNEICLSNYSQKYLANISFTNLSWHDINKLNTFYCLGRVYHAEHSKNEMIDWLQVIL